MSNIEQPRPSTEMQVLTFLKSRMNLTYVDRNRLYSLAKGLEGELKFYQLLKNHQISNSVNLFDLRLEVGKSEFQIDSLLIFHNLVYLIEVKNFNGDYLFNDDKWYIAPSKKSIDNPLQQLHRAENRLHQFFEQHNINLQIKPFLLFANPNFMLYQAPYKHPIIFPAHHQRFIQMINNYQSEITKTSQDIKDVLTKHHITNSTHKKYTNYTYNQLRKGLICHSCGGLLENARRLFMKCLSCQNEERKEGALLRGIYEFHTLFPQEKITLSVIHDWCAGTISTKTIRRTLLKEMQIKGAGRNANYIFNNDKILSIINTLMPHAFTV